MICCRVLGSTVGTLAKVLLLTLTVILACGLLTADPAPTESPDAIPPLSTTASPATGELRPGIEIKPQATAYPTALPIPPRHRIRRPLPIPPQRRRRNRGQPRLRHLPRQPRRLHHQRVPRSPRRPHHQRLPRSPHPSPHHQPCRHLWPNHLSQTHLCPRLEWWPSSPSRGRRNCNTPG